MKKKLLTSVLLSAVILSQGAALVNVKADSTDDKIAAQNSKIDILTNQQKAAQAQVSAIQKQQEVLQAENEKLNAESAKFTAEIEELSKNIVARNESLANQARSAQTNGTATSYINTIINSASITGAISRVAAMSEIVSANNKMLEQQEDKEKIAEKQVANNEAINTVIANQQKLADDAQTLTTKQAELKVAQLNLAAEKATAENEKNSLLEQKAAAEKAAAEAAAAEAAYKNQQQAQQQAILASGNTSFAAQVQAVNNTGGTPAAEAAVATSGVVATPSYSLSASTYPVGQCTWGAKTLAPWAGDYWGNGGQWAASAAAAGFRTGSQPQVGAIACWNDGGYGHVAVVTAVQSANNIQVSEANYAGNQSLGNHRGWFDPTNAQGYVTYIYPN